MSANVRRFVLSILVLLFWTMLALANSSDERFFDKAVSCFKRQEQALGNLVSKGWDWFKHTSLGYKATEKAKRAFVVTIDTLTEIPRHKPPDFRRRYIEPTAITFMRNVNRVLTDYTASKNANTTGEVLHQRYQFESGMSGIADGKKPFEETYKAVVETLTGKDPVGVLFFYNPQLAQSKGATWHPNNLEVVAQIGKHVFELPKNFSGH